MVQVFLCASVVYPAVCERTLLRPMMRFGKEKGREEFKEATKIVSQLEGEPSIKELPWNRLYSFKEISDILSGKSKLKNEYRLAASIASLSEEEQKKLPPIYRAYLEKGKLYLQEKPMHSSLADSSYMPWMDIDGFVKISEEYMHGDYDKELENLIVKADEYNMLAHGVAETKGGIRGVLSIMLEARIRKFSADGRTYFAKLDSLLIPYGPCYVVLDHEKMIEDSLTQPDVETGSCEGDLPIDYHKYYLVPSEYEREMLISGLNEARDNRLSVRGKTIEEEYVERLISKIRTYDEVISISTPEVALVGAEETASSLLGRESSGYGEADAIGPQMPGETRFAPAAIAMEMSRMISASVSSGAEAGTGRRSPQEPSMDEIYEIVKKAGAVYKGVEDLRGVGGPLLVECDDPETRVNFLIDIKELSVEKIKEMLRELKNFKSIIENAGGEFLGMQDRSLVGKPPVVLFNDPVTKTTLAVEKGNLSFGSITKKLNRSREVHQGL